MLDKAIEKIKVEIENEKKDINVKYVGEFLIEKLNNNHGISEKILNSDKTIKGCISEMRKIAEKRQVDRCGLLNPEEGFGIALKYFDIESTSVMVAPIPKEVVLDPVAPIAQNKKPSVEFNVELDF